MNASPDSTRRPIPRSLIPVGVEAGLRPSLDAMAGGRIIVIDSFRSWQCGTWIGDLTVEWRLERPGPTFVELAPVGNVPLFAHARLLGLLRMAGPVLRRGWLPFLGGLAMTLERPELWIDFLDSPASFGGLER